MLTRSANITSGTLSEVYAWANASLGEEFFVLPPMPDSYFGRCFLGVYRMPNDEVVTSLFTQCDAAEEECDVGELVFDNLRMLVRSRLATQQ